MGFDDDLFSLGLPDAVSQKADELFQGFELFWGRFVVVVIADKADTDPDVVEVVTVDMPSRLLNFPPIADFDLSVAGGCSVPDDEMVGEAVLHFSHAAVVIFEGFCVSLPSAAVVNDDVLPASFGDGWSADLVAEGWRDVFAFRLRPEEREKPFFFRLGRGDEFIGLFDDHRWWQGRGNGDSRQRAGSGSLGGPFCYGGLFWDGRRGGFRDRTGFRHWLWARFFGG